MLIRLMRTLERLTSNHWLFCDQITNSYQTFAKRSARVGKEKRSVRFDDADHLMSDDNHYLRVLMTNQISLFFSFFSNSYKINSKSLESSSSSSLHRHSRSSSIRAIVQFDGIISSFWSVLNQTQKNDNQWAEGWENWQYPYQSEVIQFISFLLVLFPPDLLRWKRNNFFKLVSNC